MVEKGLEPEFSRDVLSELARIHGPAAPGAPGVRDMRSSLWASIDNDDSRDLDQLTVAEPLPEGAVKIFVAVADVDAVVAKGSAIDAHARMNTTSVYTAAEIFPMLPEKLSTDLTSLNEGEDRLAVVVEMTARNRRRAPGLRRVPGRRAQQGQARVRQRRRCGWRAGRFRDKAQRGRRRARSSCGIQDAVAQALRSRRHEQGALDLETIEPRAVFDGRCDRGPVASRRRTARSS